MSSQKILRSVFSPVPKVTGAANAFPKQVLKSQPAAAATETKRSTREGTTKCCSIGNCPGESLEVGGTVSVVVLQEDEKPMCVRTIAGCAPLQRPTEDQACLYDGEVLSNTKLIGGTYPFLCVPDESETLICANTVDFYVVHAGSAIPTSAVLGNIVLHLNSDANKRNLSIRVANAADLILLVGAGSVNHLIGGVPSDVCLSSQPSGEEPFSTTIFRLNLAQVFGAGFKIQPKDSIVVDYSFSNPDPLYSETIKSISVKVRGAVQDKTCGLGFSPIKISIFVENLKFNRDIEEGSSKNSVSFCLLSCVKEKVLNQPVQLRFTATDGTLILTIPNVLPTAVEGNCYLVEDINLTENKLYVLQISIPNCVIYESSAFLIGSVA